MYDADHGKAVITRAEFQEIIKLEGQVRGSALKTDAACVESREGKEGLHKVEQSFRQLGYPIEYKQFKGMGWYPLCLRVLSLCVIRDTFDMDDSEIQTMGDIAPKFSFLVKVFMKFTGVSGNVVDSVPDYWRMHYSIGDVRVSKIDDRAGYLLVQLANFRVHPVLCRYFEGYFRRLLQFSFVNQNVESQETKCAFNGDPCHEYRITWK
jgi:hypothetical protein